MSEGRESTGKRIPGKKVAACAGLLAGGTLLAGAILWPALERNYTLAKLRRDRQFFLSALENPAGGNRRQALEGYLSTPEGQEALFSEFASAVLGQWRASQRGLYDLVKAADAPPELAAYHSALLWIGPKTGGLQPAGENVATHVFLKSSPHDDGDAIGSGCTICSGEELRRSKAINAWLPFVLGKDFSLPDTPGFRFRFLSGEDGVRALGQTSWSESPPSATDVVCLAFRTQDDPVK